MRNIAFIVAGILVVLGLVGYFGGGPGTSVTALIPAFLGILIGICGAVALKESLRMHAMHGALAVALLGVLGTLGSGIARFEETSALAKTTIFGTAIVCAAFIALGVKSFRDARKAREAAAPAHSSADPQ